MAKKTYIAIHEVHLTKKPGKAKTATSPAVAPEKDIIAPGTRFNMDSDAAASLLALGAIKLAEKAAPAEAAPAEKAPAKKAPAKKAAAKTTGLKKPPTSDDKSGEDAAKALV